VAGAQRLTPRRRLPSSIALEPTAGGRGGARSSQARAAARRCRSRVYSLDLADMKRAAVAEIIGLDHPPGRPDGVAQPGRRVGVETSLDVIGISDPAHVLVLEPPLGKAGRMRDDVKAERLADFKFERGGKFLPPRLQPGAPQLSPNVAAQASFGGPLGGSANENGRQARPNKTVKSEQLRPFDFGRGGFGRAISQPPVVNAGVAPARSRWRGLSRLGWVMDSLA
jgi:hypothetical protein